MHPVCARAPLRLDKKSAAAPAAGYSASTGQNDTEEGAAAVTRTKKVLATLAGVLIVGVAVLAAFVSHDSACPTHPPALPAGAVPMQAVVYRCYGPPAVVNLEQIAKPTAPAGRVLVRVHAASVNPLDWHYMLGKPYVMRPMAGIGAPDDIRLGVDFAGTIEAVGSNVTRFKVGDEVFGGADGSFAQFVTPRAEGSMALKPANMSFEQAASVPIAAVTALQALRDQGHLRPGQTVLINGASGGVGTFAVQIAKNLGAEVTGVCSTRNMDMVRSIGADHVIDYTREDFTRSGRRYDLIIDNVGTHSLSDYRRALMPEGVLVMVGGQGGGDWLGPLSTALTATAVSPFVHQKMQFIMAEMNKQDLEVLRGMMEAGKLTPVIDRRYPLSQTREALAYVLQGHARGKVIITVD
jgi:NADPH:quinone reductase-like Zn-dependent oxidoreductase